MEKFLKYWKELVAAVAITITLMSMIHANYVTRGHLREWKIDRLERQIRVVDFFLDAPYETEERKDRLRRVRGDLQKNLDCVNKGDC